jgi:uncharacterized protein (TIGR02001 family)
MMDLPPPDPGIEISVASRGMSKGLAQTDGIQIVGRGELVFGAVTFATQYKNITSATADGEFSLSAGLKRKLLGFDVGATVNYKRLTGLDGQVDPDCIEFIPSIARGFGPVTARLSLTYTPDDLGSTESSAWLEGGLAWKIAKKTSLSANIGRRERTGSTDYTAFNLGLTQSLLPNVSAEVRYYDTQRSGLGENFHARAVASVKVKF